MRFKFILKHKKLCLLLLTVTFALPTIAQYRFGKLLLYDNIGAGRAAKATCIDNSCRYDSVITFGFKYLKGKKGNFWGIVDSTNTVILPFQYQRIEQLDSRQYAAIKKGSKYQIFDLLNRTYTQSYDYALILYGDKLAVKKAGKFGIIDINDKVVIPFKFDYVMYHLYNSNVLLTKVAKKYTIYNLRLQKEMKCKYDSISGYNIGKTKLMVAYENGRCGLIDEECNIRLPLQYKALMVHKDVYVETIDLSGHRKIVDFQNRNVRKEDVSKEFRYLFD